jgi:hypothetical protein
MCLKFIYLLSLYTDPSPTKLVFFFAIGFPRPFLFTFSFFFSFSSQNFYTPLPCLALLSSSIHFNKVSFPCHLPYCFFSPLTLVTVSFELISLIYPADPVRLFTLMRFRIRILLLIKVMKICDHWSTDPLRLHFGPEFRLGCGSGSGI